MASEGSAARQQGTFITNAPPEQDLNEVVQVLADQLETALNVQSVLVRDINEARGTTPRVKRKAPQTVEIDDSMDPTVSTSSARLVADRTFQRNPTSERAAQPQQVGAFDLPKLDDVVGPTRPGTLPGRQQVSAQRVYARGITSNIGRADDEAAAARMALAQHTPAKSELTNRSDPNVDVRDASTHDSMTTDTGVDDERNGTTSGLVATGPAADLLAQAKSNQIRGVDELRTLAAQLETETDRVMGQTLALANAANNSSDELDTKLLASSSDKATATAGERVKDRIDDASTELMQDAAGKRIISDFLARYNSQRLTIAGSTSNPQLGKFENTVEYNNMVESLMAINARGEQSPLVQRAVAVEAVAKTAEVNAETSPRNRELLRDDANRWQEIAVASETAHEVGPPAREISRSQSRSIGPELELSLVRSRTR